MSGDNPAFVNDQVKKMRTLRDTIHNLIARHFPSATPAPIEESPGIFGIENHGDESHATRYFTPEPGDEGTFPGFLHISYNLSPADVTQDTQLRSVATAEADLRADLNRLFTGNSVSQAPHELVRVSTNPNSPQYGLNVIVYGTLQDLYTRMQNNIARHDDLREFVPQGGRKTSL